ncbi:hypothetical protein ASPZODRAFT_127742 [Penicilliopsis zonata CBS 506.65]|uniref:Uncharacterized protein n=1 Tax=Penicilliopsis zonata CBS 506.65 TaxID=1073090 RepID=A0A1L9SWT4_9EURO|nr:hypothetical protein ASPZODRAFT_127742 [Penicilliopsis zonata CBS 506.65]OJJ51629.1 hypothetical protein ASPZODRAFT_127742 [Penicilliopsis zonata CBS 506.65]
MPPTPLLPSPMKDGRRVLGAKSVNACLSPAGPRNADRLLTGDSPIKRALFESSSPKKHLLSPCRIGEKRTIDQVEKSEVNKHSKPGSLQVRPSQCDDGLLQEGSSQGTIQNNRGNHAPNLDVSNPKPTPAPQFQSQPEPTESVIDSIHGYDAERYTRAVPEDPEARKSFIEEKATLLRKRIQTAMRHVRDHQFDRRLSDLEAHSRKIPRLTLPPTTPVRESVRKATTPPSAKTVTLESAAETQAVSPQIAATSGGLSSPPLSAGSGIQEPVKTPPPQSGIETALMQLSSPPATIMRRKQDKEESEQMMVEGRSHEEEPNNPDTPSHRVDALDALMRLRETADKHEKPETWAS